MGEADASRGPRALRLTPRQRELLRLAALGHTDKEIARRLGVKPWTARFHKRNLFRKLQARSTIEMLLRAQERGWSR
ncbi:MAG TPA: LuxR C-terminal-related transcriptional regulator [Chloroflexota bacterium]|jgi:DNA-binding CsgD family transcriptional regulator|nr:LuxR C-terminal-related transcriptional regulator [Chloroflexota bacterium]